MVTTLDAGQLTRQVHDSEGINKKEPVPTVWKSRRDRRIDRQTKLERRVLYGSAVVVLLSTTALAIFGGRETDAVLKEKLESKAAKAVRERDVALWLAQHSIPNVVYVDAPFHGHRDEPLATVALRSSNEAAKSCQIAFEFNGYGITQANTDTVFNIIGEPNITDGEDAVAVMNELCAKKDPNAH